MEKGQALYQGKVKTLFETDNPAYLIAHFSDQATAFNGLKKATLPNKGALNNRINAFLMSYLEQHGIQTHFVKKLSSDSSVIKWLEMIPIECVVRNYAAGSFCKRLGVQKGQCIQPPMFELFLKDDALGDPLITPEHVRFLRIATAEQLRAMEILTLKINQILSQCFNEAELLLADFKLEFGLLQGKLVLGDEITPDSCRIWDKKTGRILDKDRFRQDLGEVIEAYQDIANRLSLLSSSVA